MNKHIIKKVIGVIALITLATISVASARTLSIGSSGPDVVALQTWLIGNGYPIPLIESSRAPKGYFGEQTQTAVRIYQEDKKLPTTGYVDSDSYAGVRTGPILGAAASPILPYNYFGFGGNVLYGSKTQLLTASSTLCNILSPAATTTLMAASIDIQTGTTSASIIEFARALVPDATSTILFSFTLPANGINQIAATSSSALNVIIPGSSYLVAKASPTVGTASAGAVSNTGSCSALFRTIQY